LASAVLMACGGGSGGPAPVVPTVVSGAVVKGPVAGATVCAYVLAAAGKGNSLGCAMSGADGAYILGLSYIGDVVIEATGGSYTDEATGAAGVALSTPLTVVGTVGPGTQQLVATPLTGMAFNQALAGGGLTVASFETTAAQVGATFGVPANTSLSRTMPIVTGAINDYGKALITLSGFIGANLSLQTLVNSKPVNAISGSGTSCNPVIKVAEAAQPLASGVYLIEDERPPADGMYFTVTDPVASWRDLLPTSGSVMGCQVLANTSSVVNLSCPQTALLGGLKFAQDAMIDLIPTSLPAQGVLIAGRRIDGHGSLQLGGINLSFPNTVVNVGSPTVNAPVQINTGGGTITPGTGIAVVSGTVGTIGSKSNGVDLLVSSPINTNLSPGSLPPSGTISITPTSCSKSG
jgi:hypothetical protein